MKLLRYETSTSGTSGGQEKPGLLDEAGVLRDLTMLGMRCHLEGRRMSGEAATREALRGYFNSLLLGKGGRSGRGGPLLDIVGQLLQ